MVFADGTPPEAREQLGDCVLESGLPDAKVPEDGIQDAVRAINAPQAPQPHPQGRDREARETEEAGRQVPAKTKTSTRGTGGTGTTGIKEQPRPRVLAAGARKVLKESLQKRPEVTCPPSDSEVLLAKLNEVLKKGERSTAHIASVRWSFGNCPTKHQKLAIYMWRCTGIGY